MPRKRQPSPSQPSPEFAHLRLDPFAQHVEQALEHFADLPWLEANSPLAQLYFLGKIPAVSSATACGQALCQTLRVAAQSLAGELGNLLAHTYFNRPAQYHTKSQIAAEVLHLSDRSFYRLRFSAIQKLAEALLCLTKPPLRAESPQPQPMIGRAENFAAAGAALQAGRSVYLCGPSGIGKTLLGAALWQQWQTGVPERAAALGNGLPLPQCPRPAFWYTLRNGFNDQFASLLFALGYFLHGQGAEFTWRQLVADRGVADVGRILGLLRNDLNSLSGGPPLLCIDEVDALVEETSEHLQILHLLEELKAICPTLFIGQRVVLQAETNVQLAGLDATELDQLLQATHAPALSPAQREQLLTYTRGNPTLIILFTALLRDGVAPEQVLQGLAQAPSMEGLFNRLWRRLAVAEQNLLMQLVVFRNPAPRDAWQAEAPTLAQLHERALVQWVAHGGVQVLAHIRKLAYDRIPTELRPLLHLRAQQVREARAEHLAAMYHAIEGQQPSWAVLHWLTHQTTEIERGQGAAALELLQRIDPTRLAQPADREALHLARANLLKLAGRAEEMELELQATAPPPASARRAWVRRLQGDALEMQGRNAQALERYRASLEALAGMPQYNVVLAHLQMSFLQRYRLNNVAQAKQEARLARAKADAFLGDLESMAGNYTQALAHLESARQVLAEDPSDLVTLSQIYFCLGVVAVKLNKFADAIAYSDQATECDRKRGNQVGVLYNMLTRITAYTLLGQYDQAYAEAQASLAAAEKHHHAFLIAGLAACAAEACYGLQQFTEAERYIHYSLKHEEEFFRAPVLLVLGKIRLLQEDYAESVRWLCAAQEAAQQTNDPYTEAHILEWLGRTYHRQGATALARTTLEAAQAAFTALGLAEDVGRVQALLGEV